MSNAVEQLNIKFNQDWSKICALLDNLQHRWKNNELKQSTWVEEYKVTRYDLGALGSFIPLDSITANPKTGFTVNGKLLEAMLPWSKKIKNDFADSGLVSMSFLECHEDLKPHVDGQEPGITGHCRLNYIIHDCDAVTYLDNNGKIESYPSTAGTAWLVDTTKLHWVKNGQKRQLFQLMFHRPFSEVYNWFQAHPNLQYGE